MIDVLIQTYNEEMNLPTTLASIKGWVRNVFVVDSGSTDRTREIAEAAGAKFVHHAWEGYARQKNWALANLPFESDWTLILDADEAVSPELKHEILELVKRPSGDVKEAGFYVNRVFVFFGRHIWHCGYFPSWNLRLFRRGKAQYEDRLVHEHMIVDGPTGYLKHLLIHDDRRGLENFFAKHNRYSTLEAVEIYERPEPWPGIGQLITNRTVRRRFGKSRLLPHLPVPWLWRFLYMYIIRGGIFDGRAGWYLSWSISGYEMQVQLKYRELCRLGGKVPEVRNSLAESEGALNISTAPAASADVDEVAIETQSAHTGAMIANQLRKPHTTYQPPVDPIATELSPEGEPTSVEHGEPAHASGAEAAAAAMAGTSAVGSSDLEKVSAAADPLKPIPTVIWTKRSGATSSAGERPAEEIVPAFTSPWTFRQNVGRALWMIVSRFLFRTSFHNWYGWRRFLMRCFGAKVGQGVRVRPSAMIEIPWNVEIDDGAVVGDWAILYSLGKIKIGKRTVVSQYAHLCAGTHDHRYPDFPLIRPPITIGDDAWIAADAFVGPGVKIGHRTVVGARSNVFGDLPDDIVAVGSPAKPIKQREWIDARERHQDTSSTEQ